MTRSEFPAKVKREGASTVVHCFRCGADYTPSDNWAYGHWSAGTTGKFNVHGKIPKEHCPICRKPPQTDRPAPEFIGCM